jgi:hypothetical protein
LPALYCHVLLVVQDRTATPGISTKWVSSEAALLAQMEAWRQQAVFA